jgi:hypothetical protein
MDANYIINRLKSTPYKYHTADLLRTRLRNLDESQRYQIILYLKMELCKECNVDIQEPLYELLYRMPLAS